MKSDQERMLRERAAQLRQKLNSQSGESTEIQAELEKVEEKLRRSVSIHTLGCITFSKDIIF